METDQDSLFQEQPELYPPLSGALSANQNTLASYHGNMLGGQYSQSYLPACWSHFPCNPHLYLAGTPYPPPGSNAGDSSVSATTDRMSDLFQSLLAPGFYDPGEGPYDFPSSDWDVPSSEFDVHAELETWGLSSSQSHFSSITSQQATVGDEADNTTDNQAMLAGGGSEEQDQNEISNVASGIYKCDNPACISRKPFKRKEHLTRHKKTYGRRRKPGCAR